MADKEPMDDDAPERIGRRIANELNNQMAKQPVTEQPHYFLGWNDRTCTYFDCGKPKHAAIHAQVFRTDTGELVESTPTDEPRDEPVTYQLPPCPPAGTLLLGQGDMVVLVLDPNRLPNEAAHRWPPGAATGVVAVTGEGGTTAWPEVVGRLGPLTVIGHVEQGG